MARKPIAPDDRIRQTLHRYGISLTDLAADMKISYPVFSKKLNTGTLTTLKELEKATGIPVVEFLDAPDGFFHYYDEDGKWGGIWKKNTN